MGAEEAVTADRDLAVRKKMRIYDRWLSNVGSRHKRLRRDIAAESHPHRRRSTLPLRVESMLARMELLELFRLLALWAPGSIGFNPVDFAKELRISVRDTTPLSLPDKRAPIIADAGMAGDVCGDAGGPLLGVRVGGPPGKLLGPVNGVAGPVGEGEVESTTHMRCDLVATSFATVCASVEKGLT